MPDVVVVSCYGLQKYIHRYWCDTLHRMLCDSALRLKQKAALFQTISYSVWKRSVGSSDPNGLIQMLISHSRVSHLGSLLILNNDYASPLNNAIWNQYIIGKQQWLLMWIIKMGVCSALKQSKSTIAPPSTGIALVVHEAALMWFMPRC